MGVEATVAVVIESFCVVLRCDAVEARWPGGVDGLRRDAPNATFCSDGGVCRIAFMAGDDARAWMARLRDRGFRLPAPDDAPEVTIYDERAGTWFPCTWIEGGRLPLATGGQVHEVSAVWLKGAEPGAIAVPEAFEPGRVAWVSAEELYRDYELVATTGGVETWRHRQTGEERFVGRPAVTDGQRLSEALSALRSEVQQLLADADENASDVTVLRLESASARALELESAMPDNPEPAMHRGLVARKLGRWDQAADAFGRVTRLRPDLVAGWKELTWALASLGRPEDAVVAARKAVELEPASSATLGNLAASLLAVGDHVGAREAVDGALRLDPTDPINLKIDRHLRSLERQAVPWWRRIFGA